jgi:hypothetical protein
LRRPVEVASIQVIKDDILSLLTSVAGLKRDTFGLEDVEKTLRHRIIPTMPLPTHTGCDPMVMQKLQGTIGHILRASISVHEQARARLTLIQRQLQSVRHEVRLQPAAQRSAHHRP